MGTPWKLYNGINISVDDSGEFCAEVGSGFLRELSWERLRLRIEQEKKTDARAMKIRLECVVLVASDDDGYLVKRATLTGVSRKDSTFKWFTDYGKVIYALPYTEENESLLDRLAIAKSTANDIEQAIKERVIHEMRWGGRIDPTKYNEELANLKDRYERALELSQRSQDAEPEQAREAKSK